LSNFANVYTTVIVHTCTGAHPYFSLTGSILFWCHSIHFTFYYVFSVSGTVLIINIIISA